MLREQRDEIFCFLYEATRFAKENHKKYEKSVNEFNHDMKKVKKFIKDPKYYAYPFGIYNKQYQNIKYTNFSQAELLAILHPFSLLLESKEQQGKIH